MVVVTPILLVADDGRDFGLGHVRRLEYLYRSLEPPIRKRARLISRENHPSRIVRGGRIRTFQQQVYEEISFAHPFLCVFDLSYSSWEPTWAKVAAALPPYARSIGIDAPLDWVDRFDYVIHPGIVKSESLENFSNWHGGPEWVFAARNPSWRPRSGVPTVTVTTGSQAFESFYGWLPQQLEPLNDAGIDVNWVVGKHREERIPRLNFFGSAITFVSDTLLAERFAASHVVLTRFGVTAFELTARGVPTIILPGWSKSEEREVIELERRKVALVAKSESEVGPLTHQLAEDEELQEKLSISSRDFFKLAHQHPASRLISRIVSEHANG